MALLIKDGKLEAHLDDHLARSDMSKEGGKRLIRFSCKTFQDLKRQPCIIEMALQRLLPETFTADALEHLSLDEKLKLLARCTFPK